MSPNVYNVSYTHAAGSDQSAVRGARYITRRPERSPEEREAGTEPTRESQWREIDHTGDKERFIQEANRRRDDKRERAEEQGKDLTRDKSPGSAQYLHVVISPDNGNRITDEDFKEIAKEWTHDESGREHPHVGAVHWDSRGEGNDHMHLLVARDKFAGEELTSRKAASDEAVRDIERTRGTDRAVERERDRGEERDRSQREGHDLDGEERDR